MEPLSESTSQPLWSLAPHCGRCNVLKTIVVATCWCVSLFKRAANSTALVQWDFRCNKMGPFSLSDLPYSIRLAEEEDGNRPGRFFVFAVVRILYCYGWSIKLVYSFSKKKKKLVYSEFRHQRDCTKKIKRKRGGGK